MIDAWSGPPPVSNQFPHNEPDGIRKLLDKIKTIETQLRESTSNLLGSAGVRLTTVGMLIDDPAKGVIIKDAASPAHYWRVTVSVTGVLTTADLGTTRP